MKRFRNIKYLFIFIFLSISNLYAAEDRPVWWNQASDEAKAGGYNLVRLDDLKKMYDSKKSFLIIDTRTEYEYNEGHLPEAVSFEFDPGDKLQLKPEKKEALIKLLGPAKNRKIIIYCRSFR